MRPCAAFLPGIGKTVGFVRRQFVFGVAGDDEVVYDASSDGNTRTASRDVGRNSEALRQV